MKTFKLLLVILLLSCETKKDSGANRLQEIQKEMAETKAFYYEKLDRLERIKETNTDSAKTIEIESAISTADSQRLNALLKLQKEYDSLDVESKKQ